MGMVNGKLKCRNYNACRTSCRECDILSDKKCGEALDLNTAKPYVDVERRDHVSVSWNECPTCGTSIGYHPMEKNFRCPKCGQLISWDQEGKQS